MIRLVLFQPDIPQNVGSLLRLAACMNSEAHVIEPCGFAFDDKRLRRVGMDYLEHVTIVRHHSWEAFLDYRHRHSGRLILVTTKAEISYTECRFEPEDMLMVGRESSGVPQSVADTADQAIRIPMHPSVRSLNVGLAAAMVLGEALRQTRQFPSVLTEINCGGNAKP